MNSMLMTEEVKRKKNFKGLFFILFIIMIIGIIVFLIYTGIINKKKEQERKKKEREITSLNSELQDIYGFAISNNYITALKKDGSIFYIYNLLQGTGNLGDFTYYTYHNDQLYLLFSDQNLYTISLKEGNGVYELVKKNTLEPINCLNGSVGKTSDIAFDQATVYLNTSSCGINRLRYDRKNKKQDIETLKIFNQAGIDFEYSKTDQSLYVKADQAIHQFNMKTKEITTIANSINSNVPLKLKSNILIYSNTNGNTTTYYGYNIKTKQSSKVAENVSDLILYQSSFIYRSHDTIYQLVKDKSKVIYQAHYNQLNNMQLINKDTLQVIDFDSDDLEKRRIINIDLSSKKYEITQNMNEFSSIVEYTK